MIKKPLSSEETTQLTVGLNKLLGVSLNAGAFVPGLGSTPHV